LMQLLLIKSIISLTGVVTLSAISRISAIEQQARSLKSHASAFAVVGKFRSICLNLTTPA
jgi:hypothetical protein